MRLLSSLSNRIFLASATLTVVCMGTAAWLVNARVTASADVELQRELALAGEVVDQQRLTLSDLFGEIAGVVADLPKLKAAVATNDPPTVAPLAADYRDRIRSDLFLVTNRAGRVLASVASPGASEDDIADLPSVRKALAGRESRMFRLHPAGVLEVVSLPITAGAEPPEVLGTLTVGFLLDAAVATRMKTLTGSEVAFAAGSRVLASSLPAGAPAATAALAHADGGSIVRVDGEEYATLVRPLTPPASYATDGGPADAGGDAPVVVILRSRTDRLRFLRPIQTALGIAALGFVVLAIGVSYALARTVTRPLATITAAMRQMSTTGDLARKITWPRRQWEDEDARLLAHTFNTLTASVAKFQHEASERSRFAALGRLSSVIAHEVRNPLMIIRASLGPLMAKHPVPSEVHEAAADIDEEVRRLSRLVDDALDFARPLHFDIAPSDVNRICEQSAAAAAAGQDAPPIRLVLDPARPVVLTDAERLRSVLVNLLVNARQAVDAERAAERQGTGGPGLDPAPSQRQPGGSAIELATSAVSGGGVTIVVRDRGTGIDAADLPKVFEPYFTTRRGGTGLGLAISRNIIEGLGGTIDILSRSGAGTEVRIDLPGRPAGDGEG
jgi:signal transduction histidine kinase